MNDSQSAISVMGMADKRCGYLYALMESGCTGQRIEEFATSIGNISIIDSHADRNGNKKEMDQAIQSKDNRRENEQRA